MSATTQRPTQSDAFTIPEGYVAIAHSDVWILVPEDACEQTVELAMLALQSIADQKGKRPD